VLSCGVASSAAPLLPDTRQVGRESEQSMNASLIFLADSTVIASV